MVSANFNEYLNNHSISKMQSPFHLNTGCNDSLLTLGCLHDSALADPGVGRGASWQTVRVTRPDE
jgi:hypothetical protein